MSIIEYGEVKYSDKAAAEDGIVCVEHLSSPKLVELHNVVREATGLNGTKRFATHEKGVKRTWAALQAWDASMSAEEAEAEVAADPKPAKKVNKAKKADQPKVEKAAPKPKAERKLRGMRFVFKPMKETVSPKANTLRADALDLLKNGATFKQVEELVKAFDVKRGKEPWNLEPRTYELVRIAHYYLGYGLKQDDKGVITAYTE